MYIFFFLTVKSIPVGFFFFFASLSVEPDLMVSSVGRGKKGGVQMLQSTDDDFLIRKSEKLLW